MSKTVLFQTSQFSLSTQFSSIWPIERTLSGAITPGQRGPGSNGNDDILCIPQSSSITGTSPSDCLVSSRTLGRGGGLTSLQRSSWCILQPQLTGQYTELSVKTVLFQTIQFSISMLFKCQNSSISSNSVYRKYTVFTELIIIVVLRNQKCQVHHCYLLIKRW